MDWKKELNKLLEKDHTDSDIEDFIDEHPEIRKLVWDYVYDYIAPMQFKGCKYVQYTGIYPCTNCSRGVILTDYYQRR